MKFNGWWTVAYLTLFALALFATFGVFMASSGCRLWPDFPGCGITP